MKKAAFLDLDKTLYNGYLFYEWANFLRGQGVFSFVNIVKLDEIIALHEMRQLSYIEAAERIAQELAEILNGHKVAEVIEVSQKFREKIKDHFYEYTLGLLERLKEQGFEIIFVTNEPDFLAEMIKTDLRAGDALGIEFEIENDIFTNKVKNDVSSKYGKAETIKKYAEEKGISLMDSLAIGDSEGDIEMLKSVGKGILINESHIPLPKDTKVITSIREKLLSLI